MGAKSRAENIALYAEEQFITNDDDVYINNLWERENSNGIVISVNQIFKSRKGDYGKHRSPF